MEKQQREQVDKNIREAKEKLEAELESAKHEHQLMMMRHGNIFKQLPFAFYHPRHGRSALSIFCIVAN